MSIERFRLLGVILLAVLLIMGGCALMGKGTQQPTRRLCSAFPVQ